MALRSFAMIATITQVALASSTKKLRPISPVNPYPMGIDKIPTDINKKNNLWVKNPRVKAGTCDEECFYKDYNNKWC